MSEGVGAEAQARYEAAERRALAALAEWEGLGEPLVIEHVNGLVGVHPSLKVLIDCEAHADRLMKSLGSRQARIGRPVGSSSAPDRVGRMKLKAVG